MGTVLRQDGFRFDIIPGDHDPPHVHVYRGGGEMKIDLLPFKVKPSRGMTKSEAAHARRIAMAHRDELMAAWGRINGR